MKTIELLVKLREEKGKGYARRLRRNGMIPAVVYREGKSTPISVRIKDLTDILTRGGGEHVLINLKFSGNGEEKLAIVRDIQRDPIKEHLLHIDFFEVSLKEKVRVTISVVISGKEPLGVKQKGGILEQATREIEIECFPTAIPERIEVDASSLDIGDSIHAGDLAVPEGIRVLEDEDTVICSILAPISEVALEEILATAPAETIKEPELIKKPKEAEVEEEKG
ncbi:MAG: 50S ribosomal protein L25 [Nitrospirota bacterium]